MKLIIFGGNHKANREWVSKISQYATSFETVTIIYDHWQIQGGLIDLKRELNKLKTLNIDEECIIIAKSAGTLLAMKAIIEGVLNVKRSLFIGLPIEFAKKHHIDIKGLIEVQKVPTLILQNDNDPIGTFKEARKVIELNKKGILTISELHGNSHDYDDYTELMRRFSEFLKLTGDSK